LFRSARRQHREILAELIAHEQVYELAKDIATQGFFPTEMLVCVEEKGKLVVIEGNRRVASLKVLLSPEFAPPEESGRFRALVRKYGSPTAEVRILVAPSRTAAAPLIMNRHTRTAVRGWQPIQQARFVNSLRTENMSLDQVASLTGFTKAELSKVLRTYTLYEMALKLRLSKEAVRVVHDPREFNTSALERIFDRPSVREFLGVSFDEDGNMSARSRKGDFIKIYQSLVEDIALDRVNTRDLNKAESIDKYVNKLSATLPGKRIRSGRFSSKDLLGEGVSDEVKPGKKPARKRRSSSDLYLIPRSFKCELNMPRISTVLSELQQLRVGDFENSVAVLIRVFIEMSVSHYLESTGKMKALIARLDKNKKKPSTWTPTFRQMLNEILQNEPAMDIPIQARRALMRAISNDDHPLSLDGMDQFIHNPYMAPTVRELRQFWNVFEDLAGILMVEHGKPKRAGRA
jgi:hypothetical protein